MIGLTVLLAVAVLVVVYAIAGVIEICGPGACEHLEEVREQRWEW